jgi:uncharacterized protein
MRRDEAITRIRKHADAIRAEGASALYLFGSLARDEARPDSDIDVFVEVDPLSSFSLLNMSGIRLIIMDELGQDVDITTRDSLHPELKDRILSEAVQVIPASDSPSVAMSEHSKMAKAPRNTRIVIDEMIDHIDFILATTKDRAMDDLSADRTFRYVVERSLEIISEASRHLPDELQAIRPEIPWRHVADFGNVLRHTYFHVRLDAIWRIVREDLSPLRDALVALRDRSR